MYHLKKLMTKTYINSKKLSCALLKNSFPNSASALLEAHDAYINPIRQYKKRSRNKNYIKERKS